MIKSSMSNVDTAAVIAELNPLLLGSFVGKAYQVGGETVWLTFQAPGAGRLDLLMEAGRRIHLTRRERTAGRTPPQFPTLLRQHLSGGRVTAVEQYDFDRLVQITVERSGGQRMLVIELYPKGNIVLLDQDMRIILPLRPAAFRDRVLRAGEAYIYHQGQIDPRTISREELESVLSQSDTDLVRTLVRRLNMGGLYGEEVCLVAEVGKNRPAALLDFEEVERVHQALTTVFSPKEIHPQIVYQDGRPLDVVPMDLLSYRGLESRSFETFSQALDAFFVSESPAPKSTALERRLEIQRRGLEEFQALEKAMMYRGDLLYQHYGEIENLLKAVSRGREKGLSYPQIWDTIRSSALPQAESVLSMDYQGEMQVLLGEVELEINAELTPPQNAQRYYERAKEAARKAAGAEGAMRSTLQLQEPKAPPKKKAATYRRSKPKWYERFRWFFSSDGFLVIGGRDAEGNEEIYAKYLEKRDLALHTDYPGAPLTVIKTEGREVPNSTLEEAAQFAVSYSNLWKGGLASGDCYLVKGDQVTKTPEHGEYLRKGAFVVRGERRYFRDVPLRLSLALVDGMFIGGPVQAVVSRASQTEEGNVPTVTEIVPGDINADDLGQRIYRKIGKEWADRRSLKLVASTERITSFLPPGGSQVLREWKPPSGSRENDYLEEQDVDLPERDSTEEISLPIPVLENHDNDEDRLEGSVTEEEVSTSGRNCGMGRSSPAMRGNG